MATTAVVHDDAWSGKTSANLTAADGAVGRVVTAFRDDGDEDGAKVAADIGGVVVCCVAALCSAIADVALAIRDRP